MATFNKDLVVKQGLNVSSDVVFERSETGLVTWTTRISNFSPTMYDAYSVAYGNGLWVAGGYYGELRTSTDAITWTTRTSNFGNTRIRSIAYGNNLWIAGGYTGQLRTSTDVITWTTQTSNFGNTIIFSVAYGNDLWVAGGYSGTLRTSTDGITWTTRTSNFGNTTSIASIAYGNSLWVAAGQSGNIRTSTDAITWTTRTNPTSNTSINLSSVSYGNGIFVIGTSVSLSNNIFGLLTSTDGVTWTTRVSNIQNSQGVSSVVYGNGIWVLGGTAPSAAQEGPIRTSTDAITWITRTSNFQNGNGNSIRSVAYGNSVWVATGGYGTIVTSSISTEKYKNTLTSPSLYSNNTITLPNSTTTLIGASSADTLTNKTINGANNTITNIILTSAVIGTLPVANGGTGITSLGAGIATFLGTPSSANLASTITDETGSGSLVFSASPTFTGTPAAPTAAANTNTTQIATTAFVLGQGNTTAATITALGAQAAGTSNLYARADHVHPTTGVGLTASSLAQFASTTSAQLAGVISDETGSGALVFGTTPTLSTPVINNIRLGYSTTATAGGTTTLTNTSNYLQVFTGASNQTVVMPVTNTLAAGQSWEIENNSTGTLTVNSSGGNLIVSINPGHSYAISCIGTTLTTAADWNAEWNGSSTITGTGANVLAASPSLSGTPTAPTAAVDTNTTQIATTAYVIGQSYIKSASPTITTPTLTLSTSTSTTEGRIAWDSTNDKIIIGDGTTAREFASSTLITNAQVGTSYTLVLADKDKMIELNNASAITLNIPTNTVAYPVGTQINIMQTGAGQVTIAAGTPATTTVNGTPGLKLRAQWSSATLIKRATETWVAVGDLSA